jgi:sec-independent protein translocase protein TatA
MFGSLGSTELIVVLVVVLIVFGAGKLPSVMRDLGKGVSEFKKAQSDGTANGDGPVTPAPVTPAPVTAVSVGSGSAPVVPSPPVAPPAPAEVRPPQSAAPRA